MPPAEAGGPPPTSTTPPQDPRRGRTTNATSGSWSPCRAPPQKDLPILPAKHPPHDFTHRPLEVSAIRVVSPAARNRVGALLNRPLSRWVSAAVLVGLVLIVAWLYFNVRLGLVISDSMNPTLQRGDYYVIRLDAYRRERPHHGDIVVIRHPEGKETLLKRVIGVEGDFVGVWWGRAWVNGVWLNEPYIKQVEGVHEPPQSVRIGEGQLYLLGDNRNLSDDSRDMGALPVEHLVGRATAIIWPMSRRARLQRPKLDVPPPPKSLLQ
jgi:signal peptidase I